uniref:Macroglobulin domain-containing protein n=1 Tax=Labrus bergylta TaxID=56723 RepID=A0A3Q3N968_9LABR
MVAIPAVVEAGAESRFSVSLMKPSRNMFHNVFKFQVSYKDGVADFEVELRGAKFYSKEVRKVMIRTYEPMTFVQTDKPIYLPGQTGKNLSCMKTSNGEILQLSFSLNAEAREGIYNIIVSIGKNKIYRNFKVEKYVLPKFEVNIKAPDKVSIGQEEIEVKVCAQYTYKQSVPGLITAEMCRPLYRYIRETEDIKPPCFSGCATFFFEICNTLASFSGITHQQEKRIEISFVIGKLIFIDTPKVYAMGSDVEGKVSMILNIRRGFFWKRMIQIWKSFFLFKIR